MRLLVIGANGQLGWEMCKKGRDSNFEISAFDLPELDITDPSAVRKAVSECGASLVVNAAAYTAVDKAESEPDRAFAVNGDAPGFLASACAGARIPLIHISTDYVFDGTKKGAYVETDLISPIGIYGKSKAVGEEKVRSGIVEHIILRTSWLYSAHGQNFVKTILRLGAEREVLRVVSDQYGCPTYAGDLAEAILGIAKQLEQGRPVPWGTYHYCGKGAVSWHGFADEIVRIAQGRDNSLKVKRIDPITTVEYPTPARRPANSVMDCSLILERFHIANKPWAKSLGIMVSLYYQRREESVIK